jgi:flagellin
MSAVTNTNLPALRIQQALETNHRALETAMGRLTTGQRIRSAADDAAGSAIGSRLSSRIQGLDMAVRNANDGISMLQTADSATQEMSVMLWRMKELAIQSANDTNGQSDRDALHTEFEQLQAQLGAVIGNTEWNGNKVLSGEAGASGSVQFQVGASSADHFTVDMSTLNTGSLQDVMQSSLVISSQSGATGALASIDDALTELNNSRSTWGAAANRLLHAADNAVNVSLNSRASRSRIMDADYAQTTADMARAMILDQAGSAMLSQANHQPMLVLALLR